MSTATMPRASRAKLTFTREHCCNQWHLQVGGMLECQHGFILRKKAAWQALTLRGEQR